MALKPALLDVVWCCFPETEAPHRPGSKARPVIVLGEAKNGEWIVAAYGTSQAHSAPRSHEVTHEAQPGTVTTFDLSKVASLPHTPAFFPGGVPLKPFPENRYIELVNAKKAAWASQSRNPKPAPPHV